MDLVKKSSKKPPRSRAKKVAKPVAEPQKKIPAVKKAIKEISPVKIIPAKVAVDKGMAAASTLLQSTLQALQTDFFILRGDITRGTKKKPKTPIGWEVHGNILGGAITLVAVGGFLYMTDLRIGPYQVDVNFGHWEWRRTLPSGSDVSTTPKSLYVIRGKSISWMNVPPTNTETYTFPEVGHWGPVPGSGTVIDPESGKIWGYVPGREPEGDRPWIVDLPEETVNALLITDEVRAGAKRWGVHEKYHKQDMNKPIEVLGDSLLYVQIGRFLHLW